MNDIELARKHRQQGARMMLYQIRHSLTDKLDFYRENPETGSAFKIAAIQGFLNETIAEAKDLEDRISRMRAV